MTAEPAPTTVQAKALRAAAEHPQGLLTRCGTVVRRNLLAAGWVAKQPATMSLRRPGGSVLEVATTHYVITADGRAAIGELPDAPFVDLDGDA